MTETGNETTMTQIRGGADDDRSAWATTWLGLLGALAMTSCCILPLTLVSLGVTGVFIGRLAILYTYHWYFLAFAVASLGYGFWKAYRPVAASGCADGSCARPMNRTLMRTVLWIAAAVVAVATVFPYLAPYLLSY